MELSEKLAIESLEKISNSDMLVNRLNSHEIRSAWSRDWQRETDLQTDHWAQTDKFKDWLLQRSARQERGWADELQGETDCSTGSVRLFLYCFLFVTESGAAWGAENFPTYASSVWLFFLLYLWFLQICNDCNIMVLACWRSESWQCWCSRTAWAETSPRSGTPFLKSHFS